MTFAEHENPRHPDRRRFIALGLGAFVVATLPVVARRRERLVRRTLPVMGTLAEIVVVHRDERYAHGAIDAAFAELRRVEQRMTRFDSASEIGQVNLRAAAGPVPVSGETAEVIGTALRWAAATGGSYDPAIGGAVALWGVTHRHEPPVAAEVNRYAGRHLHRAVEVGTHRGAPVIRLRDADASLDLGAIAKGHAVDRAAEALRAWGVRDGLVNVGGDLHAIGSSPDGNGWEVGIQSPEDARSLAATLTVSDAAVATSGTYQQFFRYRGRVFHHLLDPDTGSPRTTGVRSLTIQAARCIDADVATTALYGRPESAAAQLLSTLSPGARIVSVL